MSSHSPSVKGKRHPKRKGAPRPRAKPDAAEERARMLDRLAAALKLFGRDISLFEQQQIWRTFTQDDAESIKLALDKQAPWGEDDRPETWHEERHACALETLRQAGALLLISIDSALRLGTLRAHAAALGWSPQTVADAHTLAAQMDRHRRRAVAGAEKDRGLSGHSVE